MHPALWGGDRTFQGGEPTRLQLIDANAFDSGVTLLRYVPEAPGEASAEVTLAP